MHQTIVLKKVSKTWEGAVLSNARFERAVEGDTLEVAALKGLVNVLTDPSHLTEGSTVMIEVQVDSAEEVARQKSLEDASRAEREAAAELQKLETTIATREKVRLKREQLKQEQMSGQS